MNSKSCVLYIGHNNDDTSYKNYKFIKNQLDKNKYDLIWCAPEKFQNDKNIQWFTYNNKKIIKKHFVNPSIIVEDFYIKNPNYKFYYVYEWDVHYEGNINSLMQELDEKLDADLLGSYIGNYDIKKHGYYYSFKSINILTKFVLRCCREDLVKGCFSFARLSNRALEVICGYSRIRQQFLYEIYWPSMCKLSGLKILSLNRQGTSAEYFCDYDIMNDKTFHWKALFKSIEKFKKGTFYTKYIWV